MKKRAMVLVPAMLLAFSVFLLAGLVSDGDAKSSTDKRVVKGGGKAVERAVDLSPEDTEDEVRRSRGDAVNRGREVEEDTRTEESAEVVIGEGEERVEQPHDVIPE
jgi:hypothetical protein